MIRINLLPFRVARKKENIRRQISIFFLTILLTFVALFGYTQMVNKKIETVKDQITQVDQQIAKYKEKATRVKQIKNDLVLLEEKLDIVDSLQKQRDKQLILFDSMTRLIVPGRMWLENFKTTEKSVTIKGIAFDNPTIADFMEKLEKSPLFDKVDLKTAQMKKFKGDAMLKSFELLCRKTQPVKEKKAGEKKGKK
jgi:type IV pilus assembly protein PilN